MEKYREPRVIYKTDTYSRTNNVVAHARDVELFLIYTS